MICAESDRDRDLPDVLALLEHAGLSSNDLYAPGCRYWRYVRNGRLVGFCGLERSGHFRLLRSVAVHEAARGQGVARQLVGAVEAFAREQGIRHIYLFSKDSAAFFEGLGWTEIPVEEAARLLPEAPQVIRYNAHGWYPNERAFCRDLDQE